MTSADETQAKVERLLDELSEAERIDPFGPGTVMVRIGGATFKCAECGSNCFQRHKTESVYRCNGCEATYTGE